MENIFMKNTGNSIVYFSGTGNSFLLASTLSTLQGEVSLSSIPKILKDPTLFSVPSTLLIMPIEQSQTILNHTRIKHAKEISRI